MEPDRDGGGTQQARAPPDPTPSLNESAPAPANLPPATADTDSKASGHDSLVTVRLSEPPSLHLNTTVPPSTILARKSPIPNHGTSNAMAETLDEEDDDDDDDDDSESEIFEPETKASKRRPNLLQELGQAGSESTDEEGGRTKRRDSCSSSGSERVDWEELQKKEELELKGQSSNNVRFDGLRYTCPPN
jgi:hypothetical protein